MKQKSRLRGLWADRLNSARWLLPISSNIVSLWENNRLTQFPDESKGEQNPFVWTHSMNQWEMMRQEPELKRAFDSYMPVRRDGLRVPWHEIYPASTELDVKGYSEPHEPPLLVDIGGNTGYDAASFKAKNPHIKGRCVVQDLPETLASSVAPEGIERMVYDIFTPQPIKGESWNVRSKDLLRVANMAQALERISSRLSSMILTTMTAGDC